MLNSLSRSLFCSLSMRKYVSIFIFIQNDEYEVCVITDTHTSTPSVWEKENNGRRTQAQTQNSGPSPETFWFTTHSSLLMKIKYAIVCFSGTFNSPFSLRVLFVLPFYLSCSFFLFVPAIDLHVIFTCETVTHQNISPFFSIRMCCCWTLVNCLLENNNKERESTKQEEWNERPTNRMKKRFVCLINKSKMNGKNSRVESMCRHKAKHSTLVIIHASVHKCVHTPRHISFDVGIQSKVTSFWPIFYFLSEWLSIKTTNSYAAVAVTELQCEMATGKNECGHKVIPCQTNVRI